MSHILAPFLGPKQRHRKKEWNWRLIYTQGKPCNCYLIIAPVKKLDSGGLELALDKGSPAIIKENS